MTNRTSFAKVTSGNGLGNGYFNGVVNFMAKKHFFMLLDGTVSSDDDAGYFYDDNLSDVWDLDNSTAPIMADTLVFCEVLELFHDESVDTDIWTVAEPGVAAVTEAGTDYDSRITLSGYRNGSDADASITADQTNAIDLKLADSEWFIDYAGDVSGDPGDAGVVRIQLVDSSANVVTVKSHTMSNSTSPDLSRRLIRIAVDVSEEKAYVYDGITDETSVEIDISTLVGTNWWIRFLTDASTSESYSIMYVYSIGYIDTSSTGTVKYVSTAQSLTGNTGAIVKHGLSSSTFKLSMDAGANYTDMVDLEVNNMVSGSSTIINIEGDLETAVVTANTATAANYDTDSGVQILY